MEMNKGEAEKCLEIAKRALRTGQFDKAVRFFDKSQRLYPLPGVEGMRERAKSELAKEQESAASSSSASEDASNLRRRTSAPAEPAAASYTEEQRNIVRKIQSCRTHYEVLSVATTAEDKDIKKAYRKLALKLHPDKNRAPGAEDAFKAVGRAFAVLSDPEKRSDYDRFGDAGPAGAASSRRPQRQHYRQAYGEDVSPEEIFNMFFGGGFHPAQRRPRPRPTQRRREPPHQAQAQQMSFTQLLPLLLMVLLALLSLPSGPNEPFSMKPTQQYNVERSTSVGSVTKNIPYYVDRDFDRTYTTHWRDLQRVEIQVEQQYMSQLAESCESQKRKQKRAIHKARHARSDQRESAMKAAMDMKAPACDHLRSLRQNRRKHK